MSDKGIAYDDLHEIDEAVAGLKEDVSALADNLDGSAASDAAAAVNVNLRKDIANSSRSGPGRSGTNPLPACPFRVRGKMRRPVG